MYWLILEKLNLVVMSLAVFIVVCASFFGGSIYRWNLLQYILPLAPCWLRHLDVDSEMITQDVYSRAFNFCHSADDMKLTLTWAIFSIGDNDYILCISSNWLLSQHTFQLFLPIDFIISFSIQVVKTAIPTEETVPFFLFFSSLSSCTN